MDHDRLTARLARYSHSPLFARLAGEALDAGRISEARALCETGLIAYPAYATARLIMAKCHAAEHQYREALDELRKTQALTPDSSLLRGLCKQWEKEEMNLRALEARKAIRQAPPVPSRDGNGEDASEIEAGVAPPQTVRTVSDEGRIVSKTLAEIYASQGAFAEAILTYRLLKRLRPELTPQIDRRIGELDQLGQAR